MTLSTLITLQLLLALLRFFSVDFGGSRLFSMYLTSGLMSSPLQVWFIRWRYEP